MLGVAAMSAALLAFAPFESSIEPVPRPMKVQLKQGGFWKQGCPVPLSDLRLLTVSHRGWRGQLRTGELIVNKSAARPLARVFRKLYRQRFPIRHMTFTDAYGPRRDRPRDDDVSGSFECRDAVPSPCATAQASRSWSMHAYGLAVDINPIENPYVGCGRSHNPKANRYRDRSRYRRGMVTRRVVDAFASIGWGWGGAWTGNTKDYMHFSSSGR